MQFLRYPDSRIGHTEAQYQFAVYSALLDGTLHADQAAFGELQRIAHQIHQYLPEPERIALHTIRQMHHVQRKSQAFLSDAGAHQSQRLLQLAAWVEGNLFNHHLAGFDLRKVQNVVQNGQQGISRIPDGVQVILLLHRQRRGQQEIGHPQYAVHRRADLMAHVGQERRLQFLGPPRFPLPLLGPARHLHGKAHQRRRQKAEQQRYFR